MAQSPFTAALAALCNPLVFAATDDFAHADRVTGLEKSVAAAAKRAMRLAVPPEIRRTLDDVARRFGGTLEGEERVAAVRRALEQLKPIYRRCVRLRYVENRSYAEIARLMGVSVGTVGTYLHRARNELKRMMG